MVISIRRALLTHGGWPFWETVRKETSVKNKRDRLFFTQLFVPQASQSSYDRRAELDVRPAIPSAQSACGMEIFMETNQNIRTATSSDLDCVAAVEAECFPAAEAASKEEFAERIAAYGNHFWLLFKNGKLVSFVDGMVTDTPDLADEMYENAALHDENGAWQMIFGVNTIPECRKKGYAGQLIRCAIEQAKKEGRKGLVLTCKDKLLHYYEDFGFVNEGVSESVHGNVVWYQMRLTL